MTTESCTRAMTQTRPRQGRHGLPRLLPPALACHCCCGGGAGGGGSVADVE